MKRTEVKSLKKYLNKKNRRLKKKVKLRKRHKFVSNAMNK